MLIPGPIACSLIDSVLFQAKANSLQSCVVIIRVMRDMCQRVPAFSPITDWVSNKSCVQRQKYTSKVCHNPG